MAWVLTVSNWICQLEIYHFYRESCFSVSDEMSGSIFNVWLLTVFSTHFSPFSTQLISRKSISEQSDRKPHCSIFDTFLLLLSHVWFVATPGLKHSRLLRPPLSPGICWNSSPLSQWCHPTISSSVALFSCPQSFPASVSFPMSLLFTSSGQVFANPINPKPMQET